MGLAEQEAAAQRLEPEIAEACGMLNVATARLVALVAQVIDTEAWQVAGIRSVEQWVAWKCAYPRAVPIRSCAWRAGWPSSPRPAAFEAGELCEDQVAVIAHRSPATIDAEVAELAHATLSASCAACCRSTPSPISPPYRPTSRWPRSRAG